MSEKLNFEWVVFFEELAEKISGFKDNKEHLAKILNDTRRLCGLKEIQDKNKKDEWSPLLTIDPFTFFSCIMTFGSDKRTKQLKVLSEKFKMKSKVPDEFSGVPSAQAQRAWFFRFEKDRGSDDIDNLWDIFEDAKQGILEEDKWGSTLNSWGVGLAKLTQALFWCFPKKYLPVDAQTLPYLKSIKELSVISETVEKHKNLSDYKKLLDECSDCLAVPFYQISFDAWKWNTEQKKEMINKQVGNNTRTDLKTDSEKKKEDGIMNPLNQILYGPPGTGKTYNTVFKAVDICRSSGDVFPSCKKHAESHDESCYDCAKLAYKQLKDEGRIEFITFHQSYGYEEFIEGIKPVLYQEGGSDALKYNIEAGIFKRLCERSKGSTDVFAKALSHLKEKCLEQEIRLKTVRGNEFRFMYKGGTAFRAGQSH